MIHIVQNEKLAIRIAVCDDNAEHAGILGTNFLAAAQELERAAEVELFTSACFLYDKIQEDIRKKRKIYDIIVMDIKMPDMDGIEFGKRLYSLRTDTFFVLATAFPEYALEGYDTHAFQFLIKPVTVERAKKVLLEIFQIQPREQYVEIRSEGYTERLLIQDIEAVAADVKYTRVFTVHGEYLTMMSLSDYEKALKIHGFFRVHRSCLVNLNYYVALDKNEIVLQNNRFPVSRRKIADLRAAIKREMEKKLL